MVALRNTGDASKTAGKSVSFAVNTQQSVASGRSAWAQGPPKGSNGVPTPPQGKASTSNPNGTTGVYMPPHMKRAAPSGVPSVKQAASLMQNMSLGSAPRYPLKIQNPSAAPVPSMAPSMMTTFKPYTESRFSTARADDNSSKRKWIKNGVCKKSPWVRNTFQKGHVISLPFHTPNMNEHCDPNDMGLTVNPNFEGGIFTKRRMLVVLFKHAELMYCLPLYSFTGRGILSRRPDVIHEYTQLMDVKHSAGFKTAGKHAPIEFKHKYSDSSLLPETVIHLTGGLSVNWEEDISKVGRLTEEGYENLVELWRDLSDAALNEVTNWRSM